VTGTPREWLSIGEYRSALVEWIDANRAALSTPDSGPATLDDHMAQMQRVKGILYEAGWMRYGWPESVGGFGGSPTMRTELGAQLAIRNLIDPGLYSLIEVLAPTLIDFAPPTLAAEVVPRLLSGTEMWCQGFSEPESGSDLASLRCRATPVGGDPATADRWVIDGQKVWTSLAQYSQRCVLLTRTGTPESRHRGITAFFLDMDTPGITVSPIEMINGVEEFTEVFFDEVEVPSDRILGQVGGGWAVAMNILPYERSSCFWQRVGYLYYRLLHLVEQVAARGPTDDRTAAAIGDAYVQLHELRSRSRLTQHRLGEGEPLGADTSIDKVLVAAAEHALYDTVRDVLPAEVMFEATRDVAGHSVEWGSEYLYSRAATIYGGTAEVQRNIIARRLLDLGEE
jgi:alkylation response protein AidB-like acyl-CoA dehydrogenase